MALLMMTSVPSERLIFPLKPRAENATFPAFAKEDAGWKVRWGQQRLAECFCASVP